MTYYDPTLATLVGIAAAGWLSSIVLAAWLGRDWYKRKRRNMPQ